MLFLFSVTYMLLQCGMQVLNMVKILNDATCDLTLKLRTALKTLILTAFSNPGSLCGHCDWISLL